MPYPSRLLRLSDMGMILDLSDPPQFSAVKLHKGIIEPATTNFIINYLKEGDIFIDVGANWGYFTILASIIVGNEGLVISVEPIPRTFQNLNNTISRNKLFNVIAFNAALTQTFGEIITMQKDWYRQSTAEYIKQKMEKKKRNENIRSLTGDWIVKNINLSNRPIRIIKIDVEGAELLVLKGFSDSLKRFSPFVILEKGNQYKRFNYGFEDILIFMEKFKYEPV